MSRAVGQPNVLHGTLPIAFGYQCTPECRLLADLCRLHSTVIVQWLAWPFGPLRYVQSIEAIPINPKWTVQEEGSPNHSLLGCMPG